MQIGLIHATRNSIAPMNEPFARLDPHGEIVHFLNENLLRHAKHTGGVNAENMRMFAKLIFEAAETGVDGILVTCSLWCPYVSAVKPFVSVPVVPVNLPMIEKAVRAGGRIGLIATNKESIETTGIQILQVANEMQKTVCIESEGVPEAWRALCAGDVAAHNRFIADAGRRLGEKGCDTLILCQISMACAASGMQMPGVSVLTSPEEGASAILKEAEKRLGMA